MEKVGQAAGMERETDEGREGRREDEGEDVLALQHMETVYIVSMTAT